MVKATLIMITDKLGGLDIFVTGIKQQKFKDFDIVIVDELYEKRKGKVLDYFFYRKIEQDITHVPIHLKTCDYPCTLASAYNTGIVHARGDCVITMCDYMVIPPDYIEKHYKYYKKYKSKACISGIKCQAKAPLHYTDGFKLYNPNGLLTTWKPDFKFNKDDYVLYGFEPRYPENGIYQVKPEDLTHPPPAIGNDMMSYPLQAWLDVNGYYEELDKYFELMAWETTLRMMLAGYDIYVVGEIEGYHIPHKQRETPGRGYFGPEIPRRMMKLLNKEISYVAPNSYDLEEERNVYCKI